MSGYPPKPFLIEPHKDAAFMVRVRKCRSGCWKWVGSSNKGYGRFYVGRDVGGWVLAHRWAYGRWVGPLDLSMEIDHTCRRTWCVNPGHLEQVPSKTNTLRGSGPAAKNARKKRCLRGHVLADENIKWRANGKRECRKCHIIRQREWRERQRG